jgi:hypothetical protein
MGFQRDNVPLVGGFGDKIPQTNADTFFVPARNIYSVVRLGSLLCPFAMYIPVNRDDHLLSFGFYAAFPGMKPVS